MSKPTLNDLLKEIEEGTGMAKSEVISVLLQGVTGLRASDISAHIKDIAYDLVLKGLPAITPNELQKWFDETDEEDRRTQADEWLNTYSPFPLPEPHASKIGGYHQNAYSFAVNVVGQVYFVDCKDMGGDGILWVLYGQGVWGAVFPNESRARYLTETAYFPSDDARGEVAKMYEDWLKDNLHGN